MVNSLLATLNTVGYALRMMPRDRAARECFIVREWAQHRQGWLFLPNTADTREASRPLQSAWADMAMVRVMSSREQSRRVRIVLDELDSLNTIPKLTEGMMMMRSTGNVLVLGMQNTAQLEHRYGRQADTIFFASRRQDGSLPRANRKPRSRCRISEKSRSGAIARAVRGGSPASTIATTSVGLRISGGFPGLLASSSLRPAPAPHHQLCSGDAKFL
jgi:Type IV secretion-system coupling protein DNA-binding domain